MDRTKPVMVTGATGFVAGWLVKRLLEEGLTVHAAVRNPADAKKTSHLREVAAQSPGKLRFFKADLLSEGSYAEAMEGCGVVFHTASPFTTNIRDPKTDLVDPALLGTRNVLESVNRTPSVTRVVLTSSCAAMYGDNADLASCPGGTLTEDAWNTSSSLEHMPYSYSKTVAEKEAWAIAEKQSRWELVTIHPSLVLGPGIDPNATSESFAIVRQMGDGRMEAGIPDVGLGVVDVRDVAEAHVRAAFEPKAHGRYIVSGHNSTLLGVAQALRPRFDASPLPQRVLPKWLIWAVGPLADKNTTRKFVSRNVGWPWRADHSKSVRELGMTYRPLETSIQEMFQQMIDSGQVGRSTAKEKPAGGARMLRRLRTAVLALVGVLAVALGVVKFLYGRGTPYQDVGGPPRIAEQEVTPVLDLEFPPGNVTGSRDGRIFFNLHPLGHLYRFTDTFLFELVDGKPRAYPDAASQADLHFAFGMTVDAQNRLWLTAPATLERERTRLIAFDLASNSKIIDHELEPGVARFGQDLRVTPDGKTLLLANSSAFRFTDATVVVVDIATWSTRAVLGGDKSTEAQDWLIRVRGAPYRAVYGLLNFQAGLDGIAISTDGKWLLLAGMTNDALYRVPLADVLDASLSASALASHVERVGQKPLSDGIEAAPDGSVLVTDVEHGGISRVDAHGEVQSLTRLPGVSWADGVYVAPSGDVYFTDSALPLYLDPLVRPPALEKLRAAKPYHFYRFRLPK